jgi:inosine-uridine nucleoside N-ribohydrolase
MSNIDENKSINCWLDCDPGNDDAFAIFLATYSDEIDLIGISVASGNKPLEKTTRNVINILNIAGLINSNNYKKHQNDEIGDLPFPVIKGNRKPLFKDLILTDFHGESGLETFSDVIYPKVPSNVQDYLDKQDERADSTHFTTEIFKYIKKSTKKTVLIATGPLTNYALLILNYPHCSKYIEKIVLMGGAIGAGKIKFKIN